MRSLDFRKSTTATPIPHPILGALPQPTFAWKTARRFHLSRVALHVMSSTSCLSFVSHMCVQNSFFHFLGLTLTVNLTTYRLGSAYSPKDDGRTDEIRLSDYLPRHIIWDGCNLVSALMPASYDGENHNPRSTIRNFD